MHYGMPEHFIKHAKGQFLTKVFIDTEFTHLFDLLQPEPAELISIGCVSENGEQFYAENPDFNLEACSEFVHETVIPKLEGGDKVMTYKDIAKSLRSWIESFAEDVEFISDAPSFDWPFIAHLFDTWGWPSNLNKSPKHLYFKSAIQMHRFENAIEKVTKKNNLRTHHALDDAIANCFGYQQVMNIQKER